MARYLPATHVRRYLDQVKGEDEDVATRMAEAAVRRFQGAGIPLDYHIGPPDRLDAADEEFKERTYDQILVSTHAARRSRWLAQFPDRVEDKYKIPVRYVEASPDFRQNLGEFGLYV